MTSLKYILIPMAVIILSQTLKFIIYFIRSGKIDIIRFLDGMGGMPSSHSSFVASITTLIYLNYGLFSPLFAICLVFSLVTIYDAMGIRYESGKQAQVLNKITKGNLKESLGHKPIEVLVGVIFGIVMAVIFDMVI